VSDWAEANQAHLTAELARVRSAVAGRRTHGKKAIAAEMDGQPAIDRLTSAFGLSPFERDLLLLCAGVELDADFAAACRAAQDGHAAPTFGLALARLAGAHWSALTPNAPLRYWRMVEVGPGEGLVASPLRIDERVLHHLAGVSYPDERVAGLAEPCPAPGALPPTHAGVAARIASLWDGGWEAVQLCGPDGASLRDVAATAADRHGLDLKALRCADCPQAASDRERLVRVWDREAVLTGSALLLVVEDDDDRAAQRAAAAFVGRAQSPVLVASREPLQLSGQALPRFDVGKPSGAEQADLWQSALGPSANGDVDGQVRRLVNQFDMGRAAIAAASALALREAGGDAGAAAGQLWETCRGQSRARLDDLAQRIETEAGWDDLVLPEPAMQILREIVTQVRQRSRVYDDWGFAARSSRGLGISALFFGSSGTGKTLAAEIMARELRLDLYRIDLSQVVSKYIGETEKNLRRVFDAAEEAGAVLLFDEADALFGKRSEIRDSHDRYANIEVSYLLQRMEAYRGLAILTTNMKQALDPAFTRRIRFVVQFPFPDEEQRAEIWRRIFPAATPTEHLDVELLSHLNVAGGNIRNIALGAAFLAADDDRPVAMEHVLRAARAEYAKLERPLTATETAGWL
jgi:AAA+ superfamily predicted ATPase